MRVGLSGVWVLWDGMSLVRLLYGTGTVVCFFNPFPTLFLSEGNRIVREPARAL